MIRLIENNDNVGSLISGYAGEYTFCRNCESENICNKKGQKVLRCVNVIIDFLYANESKVWQGSIYDQPEWFMELLNYGRNIQNKTRNEKMKSKK